MISRVVVECRAARHKRDRVVTVATFERGEDATAGVMRALAAARGDEDAPTTTGTRSEGTWREVIPPGRRGSGIHADADKPMATTQLVGDVVTEPAWQDPQADPATVRTSYRLSCPLCGLDVAARAERMNPVLSKIATAGLATVELSFLEQALQRVVP